jgi:hypothetical protein
MVPHIRWFIMDLDAAERGAYDKAEVRFATVMVTRLVRRYAIVRDESCISRQIDRW